MDEVLSLIVIGLAVRPPRERGAAAKPAADRAALRIVE
jgi:hypothetical protein